MAPQRKTLPPCNKCQTAAYWDLFSCKLVEFFLCPNKLNQNSSGFRCRHHFLVLIFFFLNNPCTSPPLVGTGLRQAAGLTVREGLGSATRAGSLWATCLSWRGLVGVIDVWIIPGLSWRDNMGGILCEARAAVLCDGGCLCLALRINSPVCWRENCVAMCRREFNFFCCSCCWLSVNRCLRHSDINEEFLPPHTALRLPAESCRPRVF